MPRLELEALIPFQLLALIPWLTGRVHGAAHALAAAALVLALAQPMLLTRTFDRRGWRERLAYLALHEAYAALTIGAIVGPLAF